MLERVQIGSVASSHGIKGEVAVNPTTDDVRRFEALKEAICLKGGKESRLKVMGCKFVKNRPVLKFEGFDTPEEAAHLRGAELYVDRKDAIPLKEGEYFIGDLIGCSLIGEDGGKIGTVRDVMRTGANDVYVADTPDGELLIPAIPYCILEKSPEEGYIKVRLMPVIE